MLDAPGADPLLVFKSWYDAAVASGAPFPDAMTLATATRTAQPSARIVLYKGLTLGGIFFVTNYQSRKARELDENPLCALVHFWPSLNRQVRFEGKASRCPTALADEYFANRPRESQLGSWTSPQSQPIPSREWLTDKLAQVEARFAGTTVPRPEHWGGYILTPHSVELWENGAARLHDRFVYTRTAASTWNVQRLAP